MIPELTLDELFGPEIFGLDFMLNRGDSTSSVFSDKTGMDLLEFLSSILDDATIEAHQKQLQDLASMAIRNQPLPAKFNQLRLLMRVSDTRFVSENRQALLAYVTNVIFS